MPCGVATTGNRRGRCGLSDLGGAPASYYHQTPAPHEKARAPWIRTNYPDRAP
eukprot:CAMPEP_0170319618 /NCGR_PEP_ID=MMETSP0116_2-20130129/60527_1 /TAXON_ID=400756 /ORGANISM="Durinskia baltica, Strain CSIRO CS-38" /LENGTH=52 /DNA_ID=CAMNT_0010572357 /DNA_START=14 /DNA_END=169 /DNA_ORIENTATION=+